MPSDVEVETYEQPHIRTEINTLTLADPFHWLKLGFDDFRRMPVIGFFYGLMFWGMAMVVRSVFLSNPEFTLSAISGCLLAGPFFAMGLYDASMRMERGLMPSVEESMTCWRPHIRSLGMLVMLIIVMELLWGRASLVVFAVFFNTGMPSTANVLEVLFNPQNWEFVIADLCVGGFFAGLVYASTVVSIPMILDRDTDAITACLTSMRLFFTQTGVMLLWGGVIVVLVLISLMPTGLLDTLPEGERNDLVAFLSRLGKPGEFDASKGGVTRLWRVLPVTHRMDQGGWDKIKEQFGDLVVDTIAEFAPDFRNKIVGRQIMTPLDLERTIGLTEGNIFQGEILVQQMAFNRPVSGWARYKTPIKDYWLASSSAHPGGGIMAAPGRLAALEILKSKGVDS